MQKEKSKLEEKVKDNKMYVKTEQQNSKPPIIENQQMHYGETGAGVPAFLAKLWRLVDDPETNNLICWSKDGRSFIIQNQAQFARELLPLNYKHNNMASFIRQLNMYGFHKITSIDNGGLKFDRDEMEFTHPYFKRNCSYLLEHIKRKISNTKSHDEKAAVKPEAVTKVLQDVRAMRGRQDSLDSRFNVMKQENEALWREIASLRQKHAKQQQIVNKLIQFLITIVQPSRNMSGVKRHMQLMINDAPEVNFRNASESESECGPVIHELGEELLEEAAEADDADFMDPVSPYVSNSVTHADTESPSPLHMERPQSSTSISSQHYDYSNQSFEDALTGNNLINNLANQQQQQQQQQQRNRTPIPTSNTTMSVNNGSVVQSVSPDGVQIVYHVTEVPDAHPNEQDGGNNAGNAPKTPTNAFNEENVLTTPMVREQMARSQMLKKKNKQRRAENDQADAVAYKTSQLSGKLSRIQQQQKQQVKLEQQQQQQQQQQSVKMEPNDMNVDPMLFLNTYDDNNRRLTPDPRLYSPNFNEDSAQSSSNVNLAMTGPSISPRPGSSNASNGSNAAQQLLARPSPPNLYNAGDFLNENIPNDLFDDSSILSTGTGGGDNSNLSENFKLNEQQQFGLTTARNGKFSAYAAGNGKTVNNGNNNNKNIVGENNSTPTPTNLSTLPSTSAAAAAQANSSGLVGNNNGNGNGNNMAVTKYQRTASGNGGGGGNSNGGHEDVMRLSTADEVHGHLENVQDELESLRELLRSDGYSLDANTLMSLLQNEGFMQNANNSLSNMDADIINKLGLIEGTPNQNNNAMYTLDTELLSKLFNDSDVLGPYGLPVNPDLPINLNQNDKKGSELMTYQPVYDLSDILDKSELEEANSPSGPLPLTTGSNQGPNSSVLNTPYHE